MVLLDSISNLWTPKSVGSDKLPPDAEGTRVAISRIGYTLEQSVADLVDNSIDAGADKVLIRFVKNEDAVVRIAIADNGTGMDASTLLEAMRFGARTKHNISDLGKYGYGLKSASFGQCDKLTVITRQQGGRATARRWTNDSVNDDWSCERVEDAGAEALLNLHWADLDLSKSGTVILWEDLHDPGRTDKGPDHAIFSAAERLTKHLGLVFHRFIGESLEIKIDGYDENEGRAGVSTEVAPMDPFGYPTTGHSNFPKDFLLDFGASESLKLTSHIWPPKSKDPGYKLGGGKTAERQGFYFYRNKRLIQAGGWNRVRESDAEPHFSLARVAVDLPPELDHAFSLNVQKSGVTVPRTFAEKLFQAEADGITFKDYISLADETYRAKPPAGAEDFPLVMGKGVPNVVSGQSEKLFDDGEGRFREVSFRWDILQTGQFFSIDKETNTISLNKKYRKKVLGEKRGSTADAPLIKTLLFLLLRDDFDRKAVSAKHKKWLKACNDLLVKASKEL